MPGLFLILHKGIISVISHMNLLVSFHKSIDHIITFVGLLLGLFEGWVELEGTCGGSCDGSKVDVGETPTH
jgi:hypothetical protein